MSPPAELEGIRRTAVEHYEVSIQEIGSNPAAARVTRLQGSPDRIDEGIRHAQEAILPRARALDGWQGVLFLVDRESGDGVIITLWESAEARQASEDAANQLRQETAAAGGETILGIERYEVVGIDVRARAGIS
jgi:heme-degrading monooxygenase HmoA